MTAQAALEELHVMLRQACDGASPPRPAAVRYSACLSCLMASGWSSALPGFLVQCVTLDRFREFIGLYDPRVDVRIVFVDAAFSRTRAIIGSSQVIDIFAPGS